MIHFSRQLDYLDFLTYMIRSVTDSSRHLHRNYWNYPVSICLRWIILIGISKSIYSVGA